MFRRLITLSSLFCLLLSGCSFPAGFSKPITPTTTLPPSVTPTPTITPTPSVTPYTPKVRSLVTLEMVKNLDAAIPISLDENNNLVGLPEKIDPDRKEHVKKQYQALIKKFGACDAFYSEDPLTGHHVLNLIIGGTVFHRIRVNEEGGKELYNYPTTFEYTDGEVVLVGDYSSVLFIGNTIGVLWEDGVPQLLANRVVLPNGDSYFTHYLVYTEPYSYTANLWKEVPGVSDVMAGFPSAEYELNPKHTQSISYKYMGVQMNGEVITDDSIRPASINKVTISDDIFAEYVARLLFGVWWKNGPEQHAEAAEEGDFEEFMRLWAQAQNSGAIEDWSKVQINNIWANDLADGAGYDQQPYSMWFMYEGETPDGIRDIENFSIVLLGSDGDLYVTKWWWKAGFGVNLNKETLSLYYYYIDYSNTWGPWAVATGGLSGAMDFILKNRGGEVDNIDFINHNSSLEQLLRWGLVVQ